MSISKLNHKKNPFTFDASNLDFIKLDSLEIGKVYVIRGCYINTKALYGDHGVMITDTGKIDLPPHLNDSIKAILDDESIIADINAGKSGFKPYVYQDKKGVNRLSIEFVDIG